MALPSFLEMGKSIASRLLALENKDKELETALKELIVEYGGQVPAQASMVKTAQTPEQTSTERGKN